MIRRILTAAVAASAVVVLAGPAQAAPTTARPTPLVLHSPHHFSRKPGTMTHIGHQKLTGLRWTLWNQVKATGHGKIHTGGHEFTVQVRLMHPVRNLGIRYFKDMRLDWQAGTIHHVQFWTVATGSGNWREVAGQAAVLAARDRPAVDEPNLCIVSGSTCVRNSGSTWTVGNPLVESTGRVNGNAQNISFTATGNDGNGNDKGEYCFIAHPSLCVGMDIIGDAILQPRSGGFGTVFIRIPKNGAFVLKDQGMSNQNGVEEDLTAFNSPGLQLGAYRYQGQPGEYQRLLQYDVS
jgi:hypothetical protein